MYGEHVFLTYFGPLFAHWAVNSSSWGSMVDTGSMVSIFVESFFVQHFEPWDQEMLDSRNWLRLNG